VKEPFFQGAEAGARSGVGLGLSVVERLVVQMQGRVTVESVVRRGTVVSVTLPLPLAGPPASSGRDLEESPLRVLVVDDSAPARELAVAAVTALGGIAVAAATAEAAHRLALAGQFDVVLLDYRLADADGLAVARDLRRDLAEVGRRTIIVLLTADAFVEARVGDPDCPVDLVVRKPLRREHLREVLLGAASGQLVAARAEWREESPTSRVLDASVVRELRQSRDGSGQTLFERLGRKVLAQVGTALAQLEASRGGLVAPAVAALAHRAKGDCLTVGARRAARAAGELEDAALGGTEEVACEALEALLVAWADARVAMEDTFDAERPPRSDV
jgi:CheY-like chemotaxis protein